MTKKIKLSEVKITEGNLAGLVLKPNNKKVTGFFDGTIKAVYTATDGPSLLMTYHGKQGKQTVEEGVTELVKRFLALIPPSVCYTEKSGYSNELSGRPLEYVRETGSFIHKEEDQHAEELHGIEITDEDNTHS